MPVEQIVPKQNLATAVAPTKYSNGLWDGFPLDSILNGFVDGRVDEWNFARGFKPSTNINAAEAYWDQGLMAFGDNGATITQTTGLGNLGFIALGSDGDNEGAYIRQPNGPWKISRATKDVCFEAIIEDSTITVTKHGLFVGLMADTACTAIVPITAAGALADVGLVGFWRQEGGTTALDFVYKASGIAAVTVLAAAGTLAAATPISVGFRYTQAPDFDTSTNFILRAYVNGAPVASAFKQIPSAAGTDFPNNVGLGFVFGCLNATATTPGTAGIHRVRIGQVF
jgi:hypothetical protein